MNYTYNWDQMTLESIEEMEKQSRSMLKNMNLSGYTTEVHTSISSPVLTPADFKFALPKGTVLKDSLFGGVLDGSMPIPPDQGFKNDQE